MRKAILIHPFVFAIYPVLFLFTHNRNELFPDVIFKPILATITATLILLVGLGYILKNKEKAGLLVSTLLFMFFSYGHIYRLIANFSLDVEGFNIVPRFIFPVWIFLLLLCAYFALKIRKNLLGITTALNIIGIFLLGFLLVSIVTYEMKTKPISQNVSLRLKDSEIPMINTSITTNSHPDIYYIIFDRYANLGILKDFFYYDDSDFINYLTSKGFYIAAESNANYPATSLSLASTLNMQYLNNMEDSLNDQTIFYKLIENNKVHRFLKQLGYKYIHVGSRWEPTRTNKYADINFDFGLPLDEFSIELIETTMLGPIFDFTIFNNVERNRILRSFEILNEIPQIEGPKFVFAHFLIPHPPYLFGPNGEQLTNKEIGERTESENYLNQVSFVNLKVKILVDNLLSNSKNPPIIILQSDEGPYIFLEELNNAESLNENSLRIRTRILNAYYLPGKNTDFLYPSVSPVNSFRLIFNNFLNTNLELLKDESYINASDESHRFINITQRITN